jgi:hypothetical protein
MRVKGSSITLAEQNGDLYQPKFATKPRIGEIVDMGKNKVPCSVRYGIVVGFPANSPEHAIVRGINPHTLPWPTAKAIWL